MADNGQQHDPWASTAAAARSALDRLDQAIRDGDFTEDLARREIDHVELVASGGGPGPHHRLASGMRRQATRLIHAAPEQRERLAQPRKPGGRDG